MQQLELLAEPACSALARQEGSSLLLLVESSSSVEAYHRGVPERRALRLVDGTISVLTEGRFDTELDLQKVFVAHPELLPGDDLGLGTLVSLAWELDLGAGPMDLLAVDRAGRLVIVEFKKGTENSDVRTVIAQLLDYGSSLWRTDIETLEQRCGDNGSYTILASGTGLTQHVSSRLLELGEVAPDEDALQQGIVDNLADGTYVFAYVARDLDPRTRRVLTYLSDGAGLAMFAVEVDNFRTENRSEAVLVPRVAFVPSALIEQRGKSSHADPATDRLFELVAPLAEAAGAQRRRAETGWSWPDIGLGLYRSSSGLQVDVSHLRRRLGDDKVNMLTNGVKGLLQRNDLPKLWWAIPPSRLVERWEDAGRGIVEELVGGSGGSRADALIEGI